MMAVGQAVYGSGAPTEPGAPGQGPNGQGGPGGAGGSPSGTVEGEYREV
jgi:hypothetical protein